MINYILITGVAGFIGSNLAKFFLAKKYKIIGVDNLSNGRLINLKNIINNENFNFYKIDLSNIKKTNFFFSKIIKQKRITEVWHLAANSNILKGINNLDIDFKNTYLTTFNILKQMKKFKIKKIYFTSSSAIYGDKKNIKIKEDDAPFLPISNYGSMKLSSENIISFAFHNFLSKAIIFRLPNIVGMPMTHGVIYDFYKKLKKNPLKLNVLGNGNQNKIYMGIEDLIDIFYFFKNKFKKKIITVNIGPNDNGISIKKIINLIKKKNKKMKAYYQKELIGWPGDIPKYNLSTEKLKKLGWKKKINTTNTIREHINKIFKVTSIK
jgi:UDP-glucose 4-epimerase